MALAPPLQDQHSEGSSRSSGSRDDDCNFEPPLWLKEDLYQPVTGFFNQIGIHVVVNLEMWQGLAVN